nr:hypothetical protein [Desulfobacterales bacterium]
MKRFSLGLRAEIMSSLSILLIGAMISINIVALEATRRELLEEKRAMGMAVIQKIQKMVDIRFRDKRRSSQKT